MQKVIGIGELLWDVLPDGKKLGGAPCNFIYHTQQLGSRALAISAIGNDENGREILDLLKTKNISTELVQVNNKPTGTVNVKVNDRGIPDYQINENVAWDYIRFDKSIQQKVKEADIVCFGSLAQRDIVSQETIEKILNCCRKDALILFDINLRQHFYTKEIIEKSLQVCNVLKLNEDELPIILRLLHINIENEELQIFELIKRYNLKLVAFTKGSKDSLLLTPSEKSYLLTPKVVVKDTIGAGDSFTAAMITEFAKGNSLKLAHKKAVEIAAFVCTQNGAMPKYH